MIREKMAIFVLLFLIVIYTVSIAICKGYGNWMSHNISFLVHLCLIVFPLVSLFNLVVALVVRKAPNRSSLVYAVGTFALSFLWFGSDMYMYFRDIKKTNEALML